MRSSYALERLCLMARDRGSQQRLEPIGDAGQGGMNHDGP